MCRSYHCQLCICAVLAPKNLAGDCEQQIGGAEHRERSVGDQSKKHNCQGCLMIEIGLKAFPAPAGTSPHAHARTHTDSHA